VARGGFIRRASPQKRRMPPPEVFRVTPVTVARAPGAPLPMLGGRSTLPWPGQALGRDARAVCARVCGEGRDRCQAACEALAPRAPPAATPGR
jgi:hypothetical protein